MYEQVKFFRECEIFSLLCNFEAKFNFITLFFYSINILKRQAAATKLESCYCEGTEDFDCVGIKMNMEELCFSTKNEINTDTKSSSASGKKNHKMAMIFLITTTIATILHWI